MDVLAVCAVVLGAPAGLACLWYWSSRPKRRERVRRGAAVGMLGIADEIFRPETHQAHEILKIQSELPAPAPAPGDPADSTNPYAGTIRLPKSES